MKKFIVAFLSFSLLVSPVMAAPGDWNTMTTSEKTEFYKQLDLLKKEVNKPRKPVTKAQCKEFARIAAKYKVDEPICVRKFKEFVRNPFQGDY